MMKGKAKLAYAFLRMSVTQRYAIAKKLDLLEPEELSNPALLIEGKRSAQVLIRAKNRNILDKLFEAVFPNESSTATENVSQDEEADNVIPH